MGGKTLRKMGMTKIDQDDLAELGELLQAGKLVPVIDQSFLFSQTVETLSHDIENHAQGNIVIQVFKG